MITVYFLINRDATATASREAFVLCAKTVIPVLFPHIILSRMISDLSPKNENPKLQILAAIALGMICGNPVGASLVSDLHKKKILTDSEAEKLLIGTSCTSPAFCIGVIGDNLFNDQAIGLAIWLIGVILSLSISFPVVIRHKSKSICTHTEAEDLPDVITASIRRGTETCLNITGSIVIFYIITNAFVSNMAILPSNTVAFIAAILEISTGAVYAASLDFNSGLPYAAFAAIFGGLSVYTQIMTVAPKVSKKYYLLVKFVSGMTAFIFFKTLIPFFQQYT